MIPTKREQIIEAAHAMFLEHGFGASSMDAIAARANVSKRTIYSHFESKEALFGEVVSQFCVRMSGAMQDGMGDYPIEEKLRIFAHQLIDIILHPEAVATLRTVMAEKDQFPALAQAFWESGPQQHLNGLSAILSEARELNIADTDLAARQFAGAVKGPYFLSAMLGVEKPPSTDEVDAHIELSIERFLRAVRT